MNRSLLLLAFVVAALAAGCGPKPESAPADSSSDSKESARKETQKPSGESSALKEGWTEVKASGFQVNVPPKWKAIDLTSSDLSAMIDAASKENEGVRMSASQFKTLAAQGMVKLMVFGEVDPAGPFAENMNVVVTDAPPSITSDMMVEGYKAQMKSMAVPGTDPSGAAYSLPAGEGAKLKTEISMSSGNAKSVSSLAYMVAKGGKLYTITFSSLPGRAAEIEKLADEVMQTLRID